MNKICFFKKIFFFIINFKKYGIKKKIKIKINVNKVCVKTILQYFNLFFNKILIKIN